MFFTSPSERGDLSQKGSRVLILGKLLFLGLFSCLSFSSVTFSLTQVISSFSQCNGSERLLQLYLKPVPSGKPKNGLRGGKREPWMLLAADLNTDCSNAHTVLHFSHGRAFGGHKSSQGQGKALM